MGSGRKPICVEDQARQLKHPWWSGVVVAMLVAVVGLTEVLAAGEQFLPVLGRREGALRFVGIPQGNGYIDYVTLLNERDGGMAQLKGQKMVHVYHDSDYGQETLAILDMQAAQYGFAVQHLAVPPPGLDQKETWRRVKLAQPDWVILRSVGVMTPTALKEAAQVGFPRDKIVGPSPTCAEQDMLPAGEAARGYICAIWHATGRHFPLIQEMLNTVYARGKGAGPEEDVGTQR
jgi:Periplasmic binding protein